MNFYPSITSDSRYFFDHLSADRVFLYCFVFKVAPVRRELFAREMTH